MSLSHVIYGLAETVAIWTPFMVFLLAAGIILLVMYVWDTYQ